MFVKNAVWKYDLQRIDRVNQSTPGKAFVSIMDMASIALCEFSGFVILFVCLCGRVKETIAMRDNFDVIYLVCIDKWKSVIDALYSIRS